MSDKYEPIYSVLGQALSSPHAEGVGGRVSGNATYSSSYSGLMGDLESHFGDLIEGGIVVDKRVCSPENLYRWVVAGPMLDRALPTKSRRVFHDRIERWEDPRTAGSFAHVSTDLYLDLWRSLGARIGKRVGMQIVWEDGSTEQIRKASERYPWKRVEAGAA